MQNGKFWARNQAQKLFEKALELELQGKTSEAVVAYQSSLACWPHNSQAQYNLGVALATSGLIDQALRAWKRAVWLEPALKYELIKAFDLDDDAREDLFGCLTYNDMAKAA
jgi:tetratricopeptide (TPR) repeat protein